MKIAVWLDASYSPSDGGCYSYTERLIKAIDSYSFSDGLEVCFASLASHEVTGLKREVIKLDYQPSISWMEKVKCSLPVVRWHVRECVNQRIEAERNRTFIETLKAHNVGVLYYINQFTSFIPGFPFVATHWDISFRSSYAFPELCGEEEYAIRDRYYRDFLPKALLVFSESVSGQTDLLAYTNLNRDRIRVVPLFSGGCASLDLPLDQQMEVLKQYGLEKGNYFYYPSHFAPSKNHQTIVRAFAEFKKAHQNYKLVLTGASQEAAYGTMEYMKRVASELGIEKDVIFAGFVPIETVFSLYKNACCLVMPSYVGSTNMPPLEAMELGCPVICSFLSGHWEELGDAALYFDPMNVDELVRAMETIVTHRDEYVERIRLREKTSIFKLEVALERINQYLGEAAVIRSAWE